jgi:hypothetical protein
LLVRLLNGAGEEERSKATGQKGGKTANSGEGGGTTANQYSDISEDEMGGKDLLEAKGMQMNGGREEREGI